MAHTDERKNQALDILYTKAGGNASKCARLTGIDRKTILRWQKEYEECKEQEEKNTETPEVDKIQDMIIRRVNKIINTCNDPKKLMETYECLEKMKQNSGQKQESIFDLIEKELSK